MTESPDVIHSSAVGSMASSTLHCDVINGTTVANTSLSEMDYSLADTPKLVAGTTVFFAVLPFVLFNFKFFPLGTTSAIMLGAMLMVVCQVVSQEEAYAVLGHRDNLMSIFLLLGMMLLAQFFEREQLLMRILRRVLKPHFTFANYIWRVSLLSFTLSALFTNDASCAILTPLLLKVWEVQERPNTEIEAILLAIATSSNIGSVMTIFGNPQMALIAARTNSPLFVHSRLNLRRSLLYLGPPAVVVFCLNIAFLLLHQRLRTRHIENSKLISEISQSEQEMMASLTAGKEKSSQVNGVLKFDRDDFLYEGVGGVDRAAPCQLETILEDEVLEITSARSEGNMNEENGELRMGTDSEVVTSDTTTEEEEEDEEEEQQTNQHSNLTNNRTLGQANALSLDMEYKPSALQPTTGGSGSELSRSIEEHSLKMSERLGVYRSIGAFSAADFLPPETGQPLSTSLSSDNLFAPSDSVPFQVFISLMLITTIALFLASSDTVVFDMGLVPMAAAILSITADALINRQTAYVVMRRVDWSILMMFFGMFIYMHGLNATRLPRWAWKQLGLAESLTLSPLTLLVLAAFIIVGSNIFGNVPLTLIVLEQLVPCADQFSLVLYLAWCATLAGNLTLFGSVANLIVAQKGQQTLKHRLTFFGYLRFGFFTTLVNITIGVLILYGFLRIH